MLDTFITSVNVAINNIEYQKLIMQMIAGIILGLSFIDMRKYTIFSTIIIAILAIYYVDNVIITLFIFSFILFIISNAFMLYLKFVGNIRNASYRSISENNRSLGLFYNIFEKVLLAIGGVIAGAFVLYGVILYFNHDYPKYILIYQTIPLLVFSYIGIKTGFKIAKQLYYTSYILPIDIRLVRDDLEKLGLIHFIDDLKEKDNNDLLRLDRPEFILNRMRHRIPEKDVIAAVSDIIKYDDSKLFYVENLELFVKRLNGIFGLYYHSAIFQALLGRHVENIAKSMYTVYLGHIVGLYKFKTK